MYDVKQWLEGCAVPKLSGHIHQHQFKIIKGPDGHAPMFYKKWSTSLAWAPTEGLKLLGEVPTGEPSVVEPDLAKLDLEKLKQALLKYELHFDAETKKWWDTFIGNKAALPHRRRWMLPLLRPLRNAENNDQREALLKLVEREELEVEVIILFYYNQTTKINKGNVKVRDKDEICIKGKKTAFQTSVGENSKFTGL